MLSVAVLFFVFNLTCFGWIFDKKSYSLWTEALRLSIYLALDWYFGSLIKFLLFDVDFLYTGFTWFFNISLNIIVLLAIADTAQRLRSSPVENEKSKSE